MNEQTTTTQSVAEQLRNMGVGEVLQFPAGKTDYLRTLTGTRLVNERLAGARWSVSVKMDMGITEVTRLS